MALPTHTFPQPFVLTGKGLAGMEIGDTLNGSMPGLLPVAQYPVPQKISLWSEEQFDYYFINKDSLFLGGTIEVEDVFIGATRQHVIAGVFFRLKKAQWGEMAALIDGVFGPAKLGATSGEEGTTTRWKRYWHNRGISLFASTSLASEKITIRIEPAAEGHKPWMSFRF
jgi:hypothetical protein